jgi:hypothetical protein
MLLQICAWFYYSAYLEALSKEKWIGYASVEVIKEEAKEIVARLFYLLLSLWVLYAC